MSAWIVCKEHIDALVSAAMQAPPRSQAMRLGDKFAVALAARLHREHPAAIKSGRLMVPNYLSHHTDPRVLNTAGMVLWRENHESVNHRYSAKDTPPPYVWTRRDDAPVVVLKSIACYEYQTCEHPTWKESAAFEFCEMLRHHTIALLPGWEDAPWGIDSAQVSATV